MRKTVLIGVALLIQIGVPLWMMLDRETTLRTGTEIRFPVKPFDPADPFKGRYIKLGFETNFTATARSVDFKLPDGGSKKGWVLYRTDGTNALSIVKVATKPNLADEGVWIKTLLYPEYGYRREALLNVTLPFDTFYMNEKITPTTEWLFRRGKWKQVVAVVRVRNGKAVLAEVLADGKPIADAVREFSAKQKTH